MKWFSSRKTTIVLLAVLALLLLLNVAFPQEALMGKDAFQERLSQAGPFYRFLLEDLGLGRMTVSPVFLTVLGLIFLNLAVVVGGRVGPTIRRVRLKPRAEPGLKAWTGMEESLSADLPAGWSMDHALNTLKGFGYRTLPAGEKAVWGVRHRTAALGFLAFHLSFFLICAGGALLYYSRFVGSALLVEGQEFAGEYTQVNRQPPLFQPPELRFALEKVLPLHDNGAPSQLGAVFRFPAQGGSVTRESWINRPAAEGTAKLLVHRAGMAPVFWVQDPAGFTLDRVSVVTGISGSEPSRVPVDDRGLELLVPAPDPDADFLSREEVAVVGLPVRVLVDGQERYNGSLRPGEAAVWDGGRLVLEELRYWLAFQVVAERGGGLLIAGFVLGIAGLVWRLLWYRREVALSWDTQEFRLTGRGEYFSQRFHEELGSIRDYLAADPARREVRHE